jgi:hypothetical protein
MAQHGQVFPLAGQGRDGMRWAYRYRVGGRGARRVQRGGFAGRCCCRSAGLRPRRDADASGQPAPIVSEPALVVGIRPYSRLRCQSKERTGTPRCASCAPVTRKDSGRAEMPVDFDGLCAAVTNTVGRRTQSGGGGI